MDRDRLAHESQLFTVRVWTEEVAEQHVEWRGRVQDVGSGEVRYFRNWPDLITLLRAMATLVESTSRPSST